jgi:hypothetical protein
MIRRVYTTQQARRLRRLVSTHRLRLACQQRFALSGLAFSQIPLRPGPSTLKRRYVGNPWLPLAVPLPDDWLKARRSRSVLTSEPVRAMRADEWRPVGPERADKLPQRLTCARLPAMLRAQARGEGVQEAGASLARSRHCDRGANPKTPPTPLAAGRPGEQGTGSQETGLSSVTPNRGEDPEKEA